MSIMEMNGSAVVAMVGKDCVAIAADRRFGVQAQTVSCDFQKIFPMGDRVFVGLTGLATDIITVSQRLKFRSNIYKLKEHRELSPKTLTAVISNLLYERRFGPYFCEPIVAGVDSTTGKPYISGCDLIGCPVEPADFVVAGTSTDQLFGMCEAVWKPDLAPEELFETISQAILSAVDRDALAGWGAIVHIIEKDGVTTRTLKGRMD